jgi:hypothetical protein
MMQERSGGLLRLGGAVFTDAGSVKVETPGGYGGGRGWVAVRATGRGYYFVEKLGFMLLIKQWLFELRLHGTIAAP